MARFRDIIASFLLGEVSPKVLGRADLDQYKQMCQECTNVIVIPQGGAKRRPGTQFLSNDATFGTQSVVKLVPFVISKTESYILVFRPNKFATGHPVLADGEDVGITIYKVSDGSIMYPHTLAHPPTFANTVNSGIPAFIDFTGYTSEAQLQELQYQQYGNTVFFTQKDHIPFAIQKNAEGFWIVPFWAYQKLADFNNLTTNDSTTDGLLALAWPYASRNLDSASTVTPSATTGNTITLTAAKAIFDSTQVGTVMRITSSNSAKTGVVAIVGFTDSTHVTADVLVALGTTVATANWALSSWGPTKGWPRAVSFFQNRIVYGGTDYQSNGVWASRSGNVADMRQEHYIDDLPNTVVNSDPFEFSIAATELNQIQWLSAGKTLAIGTLGREYVAYGPDTSQSIGPLNFNFDAETAYGSKSVQPVRRDNSLIFVQRSGRKAREFVFNFQEDAYKAEDIMIYAEHMPRRTAGLMTTDHSSASEIIEMVHQEADDQLTWFRDSNQGLFAVTRNKDLQITGFHYHFIAGTQLGASIAQVLGICVAPSIDGTHDDLYLMVRRDINNTQVTYLERIGREFELDDLMNDFEDLERKPVYVDSCVVSFSDDGLPALVHDEFSHLVGETVHIVGDGIYRGTKIVNASGEITLDDGCAEVIAGLGYRSVLRPSPINMGSVIGTSQGAVKTLDQVTLRFVRTLGAKFGFDLNDLFDVNFRDPNAAQNEPIALFTGDKELSPPQTWDTNLSLYIVQDLPFPMEVSALILRGVAND